MRQASYRARSRHLEVHRLRWLQRAQWLQRVQRVQRVHRVQTVQRVQREQRVQIREGTGELEKEPMGKQEKASPLSDGLMILLLIPP